MISLANSGTLCHLTLFFICVTPVLFRRRTSVLVRDSGAPKAFHGGRSEPPRRHPGKSSPKLLTNFRSDVACPLSCTPCDHASSLVNCLKRAPLHSAGLQWYSAALPWKCFRLCKTIHSLLVPCFQPRTFVKKN